MSLCLAPDARSIDQDIGLTFGLKRDINTVAANSFISSSLFLLRTSIWIILLLDTIKLILLEGGFVKTIARNHI